MNNKHKHLLVLLLALTLSFSTVALPVYAVSDAEYEVAVFADEESPAEGSEATEESPSEEASAEEEAPEETSAEDETEERPEVKNGLISENDKLHYYEDGVKVKSTWKSVTVKDKTYKYYFNSKGNAVSGLQKIGKTYYVFQASCRLCQPTSKKIFTVNKKKYLVDKKGKACKGWDSQKTYYFGTSYVPVTGIHYIGSAFYSFQKSGKINAAATKNLKKAARYEKSIDALLKLIGKPSKKKYYTSCYGPGKDGILTYKNFIVYTYKEGKKEIYMGADAR